MYRGAGDNHRVGKNQIRQLLARNVFDRMQRDPNLDTQKKLSSKSGIAQPHISRILRATSAVTIDGLSQLANAFNCQPWELLVDTELTRKAALERMILGPPASNSRVAATFGSPRKRPRRTPA
jgi:DNA-binding Xre family transcriptional regulator